MLDQKRLIVKFYNMKMQRLKEIRKVMKLFVFIASVLFLFSCSDKELSEHIIPPDPDPVPDPEIPEGAKMDWWNEARMGMFIHYGIYSALGGEYIGPDVTGTPIHFQTYGNKNTPVDSIIHGVGAGADWVMYEAQIPREEYRKYTSQFTAENYDPQFIVDMAKRAGMKYIVMTVKHHDGFCLWDSEVTDWDVSQSPAGLRWNNDLIGPLVKAARAAGLKFGAYFSHARDWMHPGAPGLIPELQRGEYTFEENRQYMNQFTYPMLSDFLTRYKPDVLWWDAPDCNPYEEFAEKCYSIVSEHSSSIIQNDRLTILTDTYPGDYFTAEQTLSGDSKDGRGIEFCTTLNGSFGYNKFDEVWKSPNELLYKILTTNRLGGNILLNVGPRGDGSIQEGCIELLQSLATWMDANAEGIHGTSRSPLEYNLLHGPTTWKVANGVSHLYYHIFNWNGERDLWIPGVMNAADEVVVSIPATPGIELQVEAVEGVGLHITGLPQQAPLNFCNMIDVCFKTTPILDEGIREIDGEINLSALSSKISGPSIIADWDQEPCVNWYGSWDNTLSYKIKVITGGTYTITANLAAHFDGDMIFKFSNGTTFSGKNIATSSLENFQVQRIGEVELDPGTYTMDVVSRPSNSWVKLRGISLIHE